MLSNAKEVEYGLPVADPVPEPDVEPEPEFLELVFAKFDDI